MKDSLVRKITRNAIVAAIYVVMTVAASSISFGAVQIRIAEALVLLCFFRKDYIFGLTLGCFIANLFSPMLPWDLIFGTAATVLACLGICFFSFKKMLIAVIYPIVFNAFIVAAELYFILGEGFWFSVAFVGLGELIAVGIIGYALFMILKANDGAMKSLGANRNLDAKW